MKTSRVKCTALSSSNSALMIYDENGKEAYIPFQFVIDKKFHEVTKEICEITIPTWIAIDRKIKYED